MLYYGEELCHSLSSGHEGKETSKQASWPPIHLMVKNNLFRPIDQLCANLAIDKACYLYLDLCHQVIHLSL